MPAPEEFTGERFLPECTGEIWAEHWHRYLFAAGFVGGLEVLDIACGEGYGSSLLGKQAKTVTGVDIDEATVEKARGRYGAANIRFAQGSVSAIPFPDASFDCVVSFETLEHVAEQEEMLAELRRVLRPSGFIIISTPNRVEYSDKRGFSNEFHVRELDGPEFRALLARHFGAQRWYGQRLLFNSGLWPLESARPASSSVPSTAAAGWVTVDAGDRMLPDPMYFVALAAAADDRLPPATAAATLLADPDDTIYREYESTVSRTRSLEQLVTERERIVIERDSQIAGLDADKHRLESLVTERGRQLDAQADRAQSMERLIAAREAVIVERDEELRLLNGAVAERERVIVERDALLAAVNARVAQAEALIAERERVVVERDAQLEAVNARLATAEALIGEREKVIVERDSQIAALDAQKREAEALVAERERIIVERDGQIAALDAAKRHAESLIAERERIINERDSQVAALNATNGQIRAQVAERERIIVERDAQLAATNDRMSLAERVIAEREATIATRTAAIAAADGRIEQLQADVELVGRRAADMEALAAAHVRRVEALERDNLALRIETVRRASWRWWLTLPLRRVTRTVPTTIGPADRKS